MIQIGGGVLCAGNMVQDILVRPVSKLNFDQTVWVDDIRTSLGGNGANTAYALARLGTKVRLASITGRDEWGERVLGILADAGVDTSAVVRSDHPASMTIALVREDGARAFFHRPGCARDEFPIDFPEGYSHFHFGNVFALPWFCPRAGEILCRARAAGFTTSLDTGWDARGEWSLVIDPALPHTDVLFVNRDEARHLSGETDPVRTAEYFLTRGVRLLVVKEGGRGCTLHSAERHLPVPAFAVEVRDTTGAGDCFAGGFLAALSRGMTVEEAARLANAVGALSVQELGAVGGLRSFEETLEWMESRAPAAHPGKSTADV